ncbi:MAG: NUDIX domain-containing protein [Alphaproteobacteria bacterium]|nr:NUDIX domain-containing protein [Alphaproteobacteria bacterium]
MTKFVFFVFCFFCLEVNANPVLQKEVHFKYSTLSEYEHPDIANLKYVKHLDGGTGGVHLFEDPKNNKLWTLKSWNSYGHGINEILAALLLNNMGVETPRFIALNTLPDELKNQCNLQGNLFRFAEYVEGVQPSKEDLDRLLPSYFVPLALVSFWDIKPANFILNQHGKLVLIDTGGALLYRSLGESKKEGLDWSKYQMTDLQTLRNSNLSSVAGIFKKITDNDLKNQIVSLLSHADKLLSLTDAFCRQLHYKGRKKVLSMLAARLQHAQLLDQISRNVLTLNNDPFAYATSYDAAGTLNYTFAEGKPFLLIGKRVRHNWWGNLGGKSDPEELLLKTAIRETKEESSNQLIFNERDLLLSASHDLINIHKEGTFTRFRTYLTEIKNPECINDMHDHEYTQYAYIAVDDVLKALKANKVVIAEKQNTIRVNDYILHPPFVESLRQKPVLEWLETLLRPDFNKNMLREKHTQSILGKPDLQEVKEERISHPALKDLEYAFLVAEKIKRSELERPTFKNNVDVKPCASDYLLNQLKVEKGISLEATLEESLTTLYPTLNLSNNDINLVAKILEEERQHPDKFVMYHACQSDIWFNYRILSVLRHLLNETPVQTDTLRSLDNFFDQFKNAKDLLNYVIDFQKDNYSKGFQSCGISCNPTFFNNCFVYSSSTFDYFFTGHSIHPPHEIFNIIRAAFLEFDLDMDSIIAEFNEFYEKFIKPSDKGALLQFFLDPTIASEACYISASRGVPVYYKGNNQIIDDPVPVLEFFKQGKLVECNVSSLELQARLHANLSKFPEGLVVVKDYLSGGGDISKIDEFIIKILKKHLFYICKNLPKNSTLYHNSPRIQVLLREAEDFSEGDRQEQETSIVKAYRSKDLQEVWNLLQDDPSSINQEILCKDSLQSISLDKTYASFLVDPTFSKDALLLAVSIIKPDMSETNMKVVIGCIGTLKKYKKEISAIINRVDPLIGSLLKAFDYYDRFIDCSQQSLENILCIIEKTSDDQLVDIIEAIKCLICIDMNPEVICECVIYLYQLNTDQRKSIIDVKNIIRSDMSFTCIKEIIDLISAINPQNKASVLKAIKYITINPTMFGDSVLESIRRIVLLPLGRVQIFAKVAKSLIQSDMNIWDIERIINGVFELNLDNENFINIVNVVKKYLKNNIDVFCCSRDIFLMSVDQLEEAMKAAEIIIPLFINNIDKIVSIIKGISKIKSENRVYIANAIAKLINPTMTCLEISQLLEKVALPMSETAIEATKILSQSNLCGFKMIDAMFGSDVIDIIGAIFEIKSEDRIDVANAIKDNMMIGRYNCSFDCVEIIQNISSEIKPKNIIEAANIVINKNVNIKDIKSIIKSISKIKAENRIFIAELISTLTASWVECSSVCQLLEMVASPNAESALDAAKILIHSEMDELSLFNLIKFIFEIKHEDRINVANAVKKCLIVSNNYEQASCSEIIFMVNKISSMDQFEVVMKAAEILIHSDMDIMDIEDIIDCFYKIKNGDRIFVANAIKNHLISKVNISDGDICNILESVVLIPIDQLGVVLEKASVMIEPDMKCYDVVNIIDRVSADR